MTVNHDLCRRCQLEEPVENESYCTTCLEALDGDGPHGFSEDDHLEAQYEDQYLPGEDMDGDHDSAMASAGFGTDEDYGFFGDVE